MEGGHDRAIGWPQLWPLDLTAQHAQLVPQQEQLGLGVPDPEPSVRDIQNEAQAGLTLMR